MHDKHGNAKIKIHHLAIWGVSYLYFSANFFNKLNSKIIFGYFFEVEVVYAGLGIYMYIF